MIKSNPKFLTAKIVYGSLATIIISIISIISRFIEKDSRGNFNFSLTALSDDGKVYLYTQMFFNNNSADEVTKIFNLLYPSSDSENIKSQIRVGLSRPFYPWLSSLLGDPTYLKVMFIPMISFVIINLILFYISLKRLQLLPALCIVFCFSNSYFIKYNLLTNTTEALSSLLFLIFICCLIWNRNNFIFALGIISTILAILTRPMDLAFFVPSLGYLIWSKNKKEKIFSTTIIIIVVLHTYWLFKYLNNIPNFGVKENSSEIEIMIKVIQRYFGNVFFDAAYSITKDGFLVVLLSLGFFAYRKALLMHKIVYLSTFLSGSILSIVSDGFGKGMRYYNPLIFSSVILFVFNFKKSFKTQITSHFFNFKL